MQRRTLLATLPAAMAFAAPLRAADYPARPVRLVVPYPPGGSADLIGRMVAERLSRSLGQPMVVENRAGASGAIGSESVARAEPDGHTLLIALSDTHAINPAVTPHLAYDPQRDFVAVSLLAVQPFLLVVGPWVQAPTLGAFLQLAKEQPGKVTYGSNGTGGLQHLAMELLGAQAGARLLHIPYRGAAPALADVMAGHVDAIFISLQGVGSNLAGGKLRPLAVTAPARLSALPTVPTFAETGYANFRVSQWYGLMAPRGTPTAVVERLAREARAAIREAETTGALQAAGTEPVGSEPATFRDFLREEVARWAEVARAQNIRVE